MLALAIVLTMFSACGKKTVSQTYNIHQDKKYDAVFLDVSIDDFIKSGFNFGDSCDITFSNGLKMEDVSFFSGYKT